ncbi:MAG: alkaline phosphatase family protein [Chloroflexota bacterium]
MTKWIELALGRGPSPGRLFRGAAARLALFGMHPDRRPAMPASARARVLVTLMAVALLLSSCSLPGSGGGTQPALGNSRGVEPPPTVTGPTVPGFGHIFVIMMENQNYGEVIGSPDAPFINDLASKYGLAARYYAVVRHSLPNYLALVSGSTQGVSSSDCVGCSFDATNIVDQLEQHGKTWKAYAEDLPQPCFNGKSAAPTNGGGTALYVRRHNPFMYFKDVTDNPVRCNNVVPLNRFTHDLQTNSLPDFVWVTPNLINDMHDGTVRQGDDWLASFVAPILISPAWKNDGLLLLVWDESSSGDQGCCGATQGGGHTVALVVAPNAKPGYKSKAPYNHYSVLRTIQEAWGLDFIGHSGDTSTHSMGEFFK